MVLKRRGYGGLEEVIMDVFEWGGHVASRLLQTCLGLCKLRR
jgi:hypothetical protein